MILNTARALNPKKPNIKATMGTETLRDALLPALPQIADDRVWDGFVMAYRNELNGLDTNSAPDCDEVMGYFRLWTTPVGREGRT